MQFSTNRRVLADKILSVAGNISYCCITGPPGKPKGPIELLDVQKDSVLISWKPPEDTGGKPLT